MTTLSSKEKEPALETGNRRAMNSTAYRIYKLLQWLIETPLSVSELNQRFCQEPLIGKPVSSDSVWLYVNTLKALGCRIRRPSPKNNFCYELLSHPFGLNLTEGHLETLSQAKAYAQQLFSHQEMLVLDRLLKKLVVQGNKLTAEEAVEQLFAKSRSYDYAGSELHLQQLEQAVASNSLVQLAYASPVRGKGTFCFLPEMVFYEKGVVYIRGEREGQTDPSNLRLERVLSVVPYEAETLRQQMLAQREAKQDVWITVENRPDQPFEGFGLAENKGVYLEQIEQRPDATAYLVHLQIRESLFLKQELLACEAPFQIIKPVSLKVELRKTLEAMARIYDSEKG